MADATDNEYIEWGTATADDPETIVLSKSGEKARAEVDAWNSARAVTRGERSRALLFSRKVSPWVQDADTP